VELNLVHSRYPMMMRPGADGSSDAHVRPEDRRLISAYHAKSPTMTAWGQESKRRRNL
jgi:hypothetical protein